VFRKRSAGSGRYAEGFRKAFGAHCCYCVLCVFCVAVVDVMLVSVCSGSEALGSGRYAEGFRKAFGAQSLLLLCVVCGLCCCAWCVVCVVCAVCAVCVPGVCAAPGTPHRDPSPLTGIHHRNSSQGSLTGIPHGFMDLSQKFHTHRGPSQGSLTGIPRRDPSQESLAGIPHRDPPQGFLMGPSQRFHTHRVSRRDPPQESLAGIPHRDPSQGFLTSACAHFCGCFEQAPAAASSWRLAPQVGHQMPEQKTNIFPEVFRKCSGSIPEVVFRKIEQPPIRADFYSFLVIFL
jgi:hypothetical protein